MTGTVTAESETLLAGDEQLLLRRVNGVDEYHQCEALQAEVWGDDDIARVPLLDMVTAQENGGFVIGAFRPEGQLVAFVYSFPGLTPDGDLKQCSVLLAVHRDYRRNGVGFALKRFQARLAQAHGFTSITWTVDPLVGRNVAFNLNKLGAVGTTYIENAYGVGMGLNAGLETDRLLVVWTLPYGPSAVPRERDGRPVNDIASTRAGLPVPGRHSLGHDGNLLYVDVPWDISAISRIDRWLAIQWRDMCREVFGHYLDHGYLACALLRLDDRRSRYVLRSAAS
jgi:predicted GNAT superfamily acetyltransferase